MNAETARTLIPLYRHDRPADSKIKKAVQFADSDPALGQELKSQLEFDRRIVDVIRCLKPSSSLKEKLGGTNGRPSSKARQVMNPAVLCAVVGVLLLIGIGIHLKLEADKDFPGRPWVEDFIKLNEHMTGAELEQTESRAGDLGDNARSRRSGGGCSATGRAAIRSFKSWWNGITASSLSSDPRTLAFNPALLAIGASSSTKAGRLRSDNSTSSVSSSPSAGKKLTCAR
jgi:hypothetical protein